VDHVLKCHEMIKADIVRGDNCYLYDADGKKYVDFESGVWCTMLGHNHPRIKQAIQKQMDNVMHLHYRYTSHLAEEASVGLLESAGFTDGKCLFLSSGSEAVEFGVQTAKLLTGKKYLLALSQSYLAAYGSAGQRDANEWIGIDLDSCLACTRESGCDTNCENLKHVPFGDIAAFVFEPGSASGNVKFPPQKLVDFVTVQIRQSGGVVIVDEVTTGLGRTGKWYGFDHYNLKPDVVVVGKGLGNGYPVSAVALQRCLADELEKRQFRYVQSHQNDPLGCAVAREVVRVIQEEQLAERSAQLGSGFLSQLRQLEDRCAPVKQIRGRGLMIAIEFVPMQKGPIAALVFGKMLERGFLTGYNPSSNVVRFLPALTIEQEQITSLIENLCDVLANLNTEATDSRKSE
jgi:acetylornithine/N-succinyldiaminopimelate aminotransferase